MTRLARWFHVAGAATWFGGYLLLTAVVLPALVRNSESDGLRDVAVLIVRTLTYAGAVTFGFGIVLIYETRGLGGLASMWGLLVGLSALIALVLFVLGDGLARRALLIATPDALRRAHLLSTLGLALTLVALGLMTRTLYTFG